MKRKRTTTHTHNVLPLRIVFCICREKRNVSIPMVLTLYQQYVASCGEKEKKNSNNRKKSGNDGDEGQNIQTFSQITFILLLKAICSIHMSLLYKLFFINLKNKNEKKIIFSDLNRNSFFCFYFNYSFNLNIRHKPCI
jgi:hypothetical protein